MTDTTEVGGVDRPSLVDGSEEAPGGGLAVIEDVPGNPEDADAVPADDAAEDAPAPVDPNAFSVHLDNFEGPFDLLLGLISKHKLDVTEVALSQVTNEFIAYIRAKEDEWDLGQATEFLVVASTLLDLKTARLLPSAEVEDEEDLALLEARDLLFARLLQYRAYKEVSADFAKRIDVENKRHPRTVSLEPRFADLLPEVLITLSPEQFAAMAARALTPKAPPSVTVDHIHAPRVSVKEQGAVLVDRLRRQRSTTFRQLTADCPDTLTVVARFLALLELFRDGAVAFDQVTALGELRVRWTGSDEDEVTVTDEFDIEPDPDADEMKPAESVTDADAVGIALRPPSHDAPSEAEVAETEPGTEPTDHHDANEEQS